MINLQSLVALLYYLCHFQHTSGTEAIPMLQACRENDNRKRSGGCSGQAGIAAAE